jgi:glycosyltransferase involved in cell wall biosynthesis
VILGDGALRPEVEAAARRDPRITFLGWVSQEEVRRHLASTLFFVFTSEWFEGWPVIGVQALAAGTPIIVSDVGNVIGLVPEGAGLTFKTGDADSLASVTRAAFSDRDAALNMGQRGREVFEELYSNEVNLKALTSIYTDAINRYRSPDETS